MAELKDATRLTIIVDEDASGNVEVGWQAVNRGTGEKVAMRPTHVLGQIFTASLFYALRHWDTLSTELSSLFSKK